jgi:hypothetical protein
VAGGDSTAPVSTGPNVGGPTATAAARLMAARRSLASGGRGEGDWMCGAEGDGMGYAAGWREKGREVARRGRLYRPCVDGACGSMARVVARS